MQCCSSRRTRKAAGRVIISRRGKILAKIAKRVVSLVELCIVGSKNCVAAVPVAVKSVENRVMLTVKNVLAFSPAQLRATGTSVPENWPLSHDVEVKV